MSLETLTFSGSSSSRRYAAVVVVALHVCAIYAFAHGALGAKPAAQPITRPLQVALLSEERPPTQPVLPPPPKITLPAIAMDMPHVNIPAFEPERAITVAYTSSVQSSVSTATAPKLASSVEYIRQPIPQYPIASRRLREEGLVILRVLIDERGLATQIELHRSSGHERLDRAACEAVARAKFKPYLEDGVAQSAFALVPIEFTLNHRVAQR